MSRTISVQETIHAERFAFVPGRNWLVTCDADGTIPLNSRIVAEFVKEPPAELVAAMEALPELLAAAKSALSALECNPKFRENEPTINALCAAIARAEGGAA